MSEQVVFEALRRGLITPEQAKQRLNPAEKPERQVGTGETAVRSFAQGITLGGVDEIASGIGAVGDAIGGKNMGQAYSDRLTANRNQDAMIARQRPVLDAAGKITGGVVGGVGAAMAAPASTLLNPATAGQLGKSGMAYSGLQGALSGEGIEGRTIEGVLGGLGGLAFGYAGGRILDKALPNAAPTAESLKASYRQTKEGLKQIQIDGTRLVDDVVRPTAESLRTVRGQYDPKVDSALNNLATASRRTPNAYVLDEIRGRLPSDKDGMALRSQLDTFLETQSVNPAFRDQYRRAMLATKVQDAVSRFDTSEAQARTALQNIAKNTKGIKPFEKEAILKAAKKPFTIGNLTGAVLSVGGANPAAGLATYGATRTIDALASDASSASMQNALNTILTGQRIPNYAQRFGALVGYNSLKERR